MAKTGTKWLAAGLAAAAAYGAWTLGSGMLGDDTEAEGTQYVVNHVWLERLPENHRDMIGHLAIIDHPQGQFGVAGRSSNWRHFVEVFMWKLDGHRLGLFFPQDEVRAKLKVRTYDCEGEAPHPFELCMDLQAGERQMTYYSRRDWKIEPQDVEGSLEAFAETNPAIARSIAAELSDQDSLAVVDTDEIDWTDIAALPWQQ